MGSNAVYRLTAPVVVRISRPGADVGHARRTVAVARWLESVNYPAVRVLDADQPVVLDGYAITFWETVSDDGDQYATVGEVAEILVKLHELAAPDDLHLPALERFEGAARRIETNNWLTPGDRDFLTETLARMRDAYSELEFVLREASFMAMPTSGTSYMTTTAIQWSLILMDSPSAPGSGILP